MRQITILFFIYYGTVYLKKISRPWIDKYSPKMLDSICHKVVSYTLFSNVIMDIFLYDRWEIPSMLEFEGVCILSLASFHYHRIMSQCLYENRKIDYISEEVGPYFLWDIGAIHIRSFLAIFANYWASSWFPVILLCSGGLHIWGIRNSICVMQKYQKIGNVWNDDSIQTRHYIYTQYSFVCFPAFMDFTFICIHSYRSIYSEIGMYAIFSIGILFYVLPWKQLTHIGVHGMLTIMSFCLAKMTMYQMNL